jgi:CRISPR-associated protein (TIGR03984 family)
MEKKIEIKSEKVNSNFTSDDFKQWLQKKAEELQSSEIYMLSFHDDGVVWGKVKRGSLITSDFAGSPSPEFRPQTLQELRLFGEKGQLHVWRIGEGEFKASLASDGDAGEYEFLQTEEQVLHGTHFDGGNSDFMIVRDGSEGLKHTFPIIDKSKFDGKKRPLRLKVNHYLEYDQDGCARIAYSRLVGVKVV